MHESIELGIWRWIIENVAIPLLGGAASAIAWWVKMVSDRLRRTEEAHEEKITLLHARISALDRDTANTYARRDDVREWFARIDGKLDVLLKHALKDSQG